MRNSVYNSVFQIGVIYKLNFVAVREGIIGSAIDCYSSAILRSTLNKLSALLLSSLINVVNENHFLFVLIRIKNHV